MDFKYYLFISHARDDDESPPGAEKGWVSVFVEQLRYSLDRRLAKELKNRNRSLYESIWCDRKGLVENQRIWPEIEDALRESMVVLSLCSTNYLNSENCVRELEFFCGHWSDRAPGLNLRGNQYRLVNVLLRNLAPREWPECLRETVPFRFSDSEQPGQPGDPIEVRLDEPGYRSRLRPLVDFLERLIRQHWADLEKAGAEQVVVPESRSRTPSGEAPADRVPEVPAEAVVRRSETVFLAHAADTLRGARRRLAEDLRREAIEVVDRPPPPFDEGHGQALDVALEGATLSVHLLDRHAGLEMEGNPETTYARVQLDRGMASGVPQLVWLPDRQEIGMAESECHRRFLEDLDRRAETEHRFHVICGRRDDLGRIVLDQLQQLRAAAAARPDGFDVLIDAADPDSRFGARLMDYLLGEGLTCLLHQERSRADDRLDEFDRNIDQVRALVVLFGKANPLLVRRRLERTAQRRAVSAGAAAPRLRFSSVFLPPGSRADVPALRQESRRLGVEILDHRQSEWIDPGVVRPLLELTRGS